MSQDPPEQIRLWICLYFYQPGLPTIQYNRLSQYNTKFLSNQLSPTYHIIRTHPFLLHVVENTMILTNSFLKFYVHVPRVKTVQHQLFCILTYVGIALICVSIWVPHAWVIAHSDINMSHYKAVILLG